MGTTTKAVALCALSLYAGIGCAPSDPQRLEAIGQLLAADEQTPLPHLAVDQYELTFTVLGEAGEVAISRNFQRDHQGEPIVSDAQGRFRIESNDLRLSYDWSRDELVCQDECIAWETLCQSVTEEVCYSTCSEEQCSDECYDDCSTECWDEQVCDDYGCWTETVCTDVCSEVCETSCQTVTYGCDCQWETYDVCSDHCAKTENVCEWVTRWYTSYPQLSDVLATAASIRLPDDAGKTRVLAGDNLTSHQDQRCDDNGCETTSLWLQDDRFVLRWAK